MLRVFKYFFNLILLLIILAMVLEVALGIAHSYENRGIQPLPVTDYPYLYFLYDKDHGINGNPHGFMTAHPVKKPESSYRIIVTGGSVARGNRSDETIAVYLERELNEHFSTDKIEVLNAGVSAFMVQQEFILTQLVLQKYEPDMIVSLDGYNDILSYRFNRGFGLDYPLPPHNWQDFRVIKTNSFKSEPESRMAYFFKNIHENFFKDKSKQDFDWNEVKQDELNEISGKYWSVVDDSYDFCRVKEITYFNFLQPVNYYSKKYSGEKLTPPLKALFKLYQNMESQIAERHYAFSLTSVMDKHMDWFTDECHVTADGNQLIARAIFQSIKDSVEKEILSGQHNF